MAGIRLFVEADLNGARTVELGREQAHYLRHVMRLESGDAVKVFNGRDGEWEARLGAGSVLDLGRRLQPQAVVEPLVLVMTPLKRRALEFAIEKATEIGATEIRFVLTEYADVRAVNLERLRAIAVEAAEQCGRLDFPTLVGPAPLDQVLVSTALPRQLVFCDESGSGQPILRALDALDRGAPRALLIGPAGGFSVAERERIRARPHVLPVGLGQRLLRAETAAISALAILANWRHA
jgi:16S rRNA (uracil1498-N3)-methyltransferase